MSEFKHLPEHMPGARKVITHRKDALVQQFNLKGVRRRRDLTAPLMTQIEACTTDEAKRILLGLSEKFAPEELHSQLGEEKR